MRCKTLLLLPLIVKFLYAQAPDILWTKTYGGAENDRGYSLQKLSDGYIIAGFTNSFGKGGDVYLIRTDLNGEIIWSNNYGGDFDDEGYSVIQTSDNGFAIVGISYVSCCVPPDIYLIKTDSDGNEEWTKIFGGYDEDKGYSVLQTSDGGYIIAGYTFEMGLGRDVYIIKTDGNGNTIWTMTYGGADWDVAHALEVTSDGYILTGYTYSYGSGDADLYILKIDFNGNLLWSKTFGGTADDYGYSVRQTSDGGYIVTGYTRSFGEGGTDVYLVKLDSNGNMEWTRTFGGEEDDYGYSVQETSDGGYVIAGVTYSFGENPPEIYIIKTDSNGNPVWTKITGGEGNDIGNFILQLEDGGYIVTGYTDSFGEGNDDVYLVRLSPETSVKEEPSLDQGFYIYSYPNPFKDRVYIKYSLPVGTHIEVSIYDITGKKVAQILRGWNERGIHSIIWNPEIGKGEPVKSGVYFLKVKTDYAEKFNKILFLR
jgi:hypothetical protein